MKKLMFATALVASAAAFADPLNAISFEGYDADDTFTNGDAEKNEAGNSMTGNPYFYFQGDADGSSVKAFGSGDVATPRITRPLYFAGGAEGSNYLELSTEGGILWRSVNPISVTEDGGTNIYALGSAKAVAAGGTYLDTLVQFTPTEDGGAPEVTQDDKLAIWLNVDGNSVTNLMVKANLYDFGEAPSATAATFTLAPSVGEKKIEAGEWYRLTIKAIPNVMVRDDAGVIPAFEIYVDGVQMCATTAQFTSGMVTTLHGMDALSADMETAIGANKIFPSLQEMGAQGAIPTIQGIGFKGSGALDDIVWTEEDPFNALAAGFTLTWPEGVTPVSYTIDGGAAVSIASENSPFVISGVNPGSTVAFSFTNADGANKTMSVEASSSVAAINAADAVYVWADYLGDAVDGAYTIDDFNDLDMLRKGVAAGLTTANETFKQTANIDMTSAGAFAGVGTYKSDLTQGVPFCGTYDGQGYKISNVLFTKRTYAGVFNQVKGGTIKNLTVENISFPVYEWTIDNGNGKVTTNEYGGAIVGNAGLGATLQGLVAMGSFGSQSNPGTHNMAGIAVRVCGGASNVVNGVTMLETLVKDCTNNASIYGKYTKSGGITALTQDQNGVPNDYVLFDGCVNNGTITMTQLSQNYDAAGRDGLAGILAYVSDGTKMQNCVNAGTMSSTLTNAKKGGLIGWAQGKTLDDLGGNVAAADTKMVGDQNGSTITGFKYATVDNGLATTLVPPYALVKDTTYLLEGQVAATAAPVFTLQAAGDWIEFDKALGYTNVVGMVGGEGVTNETTGTVVKYWIPAAGGGDYVVEIDGSDVVVTPSAQDLAAVQAAVIAGGGTLDVTDVAAVNAAMAAPIGTTGIPSWQALFLGLPPTEAGLESFKIASISFDEEGKVKVTLPASVDPKTGRGVTITLKLKSADTPNAASWTDVESATGTTFAPFAPGSTDTKKFYKVVVEFAGSSN